MPLRDYQEEDVQELVRRHAAGEPLAIHHEQGLGKSLITLEFLRRVHPTGRVLIVCPAIALVSWVEQIDAWAPGETLVLKKGKDIAKLGARDWRYVLVSVDMIRADAVCDGLREWGRGQAAVIDEYHYLRTPTAQRTQAAYHRQTGVVAGASIVAVLSGTPQVSWPLDWWAPLARWAPERLELDGRRMTFEEFKRRYHVIRMMPNPSGYGQPIERIVRAQNMDDLQRRVEGFGIRRTKTDIDLPPLLWQPFTLELAAKDRAALDAALMEHLPDKIRGMLASLTINPADVDLLAKLEQELDVRREMVSVLMRAQGVAKAHAVVRLLRSEMAENNLPVGIGCWNRDVMDVIETGLSPLGVARIDGATSHARRVAEKEAFMRPDGPRVFCGQISACGTALTLTRASDVMMVQMSHIPGENEQFASRFHRIGQRNTVTVRVPIVRGSLDEPLTTLRVRKLTTARSLIDQPT